MSNEILQALAQVRSEVRELRRLIEALGRARTSTPSEQRSTMALPNGTRFLPGTGVIDQDPNRPRSPEVQAVIDRDERERQ